MKISAKGRYGLAAMTHLAMNYASDTPITIISISEKLGISKIYLEQVFSLLKRAKLVLSIKGSQGGYQLARAPKNISAYDILTAIELSLVEETSSSTNGKVPSLDDALEAIIYQPINDALKETLQNVSLADVLTETENKRQDETMMYFI
ncbi:RrF2 family transcriptional regulator [Schwartzia succinivorans]|jgi:Rrf2 family protein|uniref:Transcriptional regulator, BadM/Rrf2 family n=1 Tax=Schwartzia succinivorans DSM 10502 TaxID=1123243 RepID=A0A1M5AAP9_9FIRM|nr:Rrf2 family transcriptional regulator [Schwartzia succinivorans]MBQ1469296.1 Rrf2 family transcriptional regulator [Schwartzia sp. (in: firmicutes)]MBQ3863547.1 Rrf2 family transcriptional regulator [Schwartzia sp. (in: firmicutes)]MBQ4152032.1 Rrf2 family transcriptional regulator [Schwartzia sp. (in: firmicutes)]SHF27116.1 transcriptional regulator, BadM/Rrf2 family [Schwartzia succinivorans DSM 10502]